MDKPLQYVPQEAARLIRAEIALSIDPQYDDTEWGVWNWQQDYNVSDEAEAWLWCAAYTTQLKDGASAIRLRLLFSVENTEVEVREYLRYSPKGVISAADLQKLRERATELPDEIADWLSEFCNALEG